MAHDTNGPLAGLRIIEIAGLGPTPFAAMSLADQGAEVIRIQRPGLRHLLGLDYDILNRGRGFIELDLKSDEGRATAKRLIAQADGLIEGMRPGAMERLGLGPDDAWAVNPRLVYGRMTGWGQAGPLSHTAGHDINYIALSGALHAIGGADAPVPPLNLLGDFGAGGIYLAFGMVSAMLAAQRTGQGQVVDAAITDGTAHLMAMIYAMRGAGLWSDARAANLLDGGAPHYGTYRCACGGFICVGALEPQFYLAFLDGLGLSLGALPDRDDPSNWPALRDIFARTIATQSRAHWESVFDGTDACVAPVLRIEEASSHPHNAARDTFIIVDGVVQPAPAPRYSSGAVTPKPSSQSKPLPLDAVLSDWGA